MQCGERVGVFPTRVGMDRCLAVLPSMTLCIPHTRGDGPCQILPREFSYLYSPHAWGWTDARHSSYIIKPVFPTRVGMDRFYQNCPSRSEGIPHTRGDGPPLARERPSRF